MTVDCRISHQILRSCCCDEAIAKAVLSNLPSLVCRSSKNFNNEWLFRGLFFLSLNLTFSVAEIKSGKMYTGKEVIGKYPKQTILL